MTNRLSGERIDREPVAIIGIGCRYPGGADSPDRFWQLLRDGVDAIAEIPAERLLGGAVSGDADDSNMKIGIRQGGFLRDIDRFDAEFFGISPREAEQMDPQQRLLLETVWEAVEDAGLARERLAGTRGGVYIGLWLNDYEASLYSAIDEVELHTTTGGGRYPAAGRLSFALDLRGPSLTVDTACSSSLVAVHLAVQALRSGETDLSLAGGVNVILQPQISIAYSRSGMLAPDGRSKFGDARANGYVRSEGCGVVLLKRLSDALADGDPIHAVIRGSAINNDGQGSGLLVQPSVDGQMAMLRDAYADAGVSPGAVSYVEAHGTGTLAGDPVELQAIGAVLGEGRAADNHCLVGSVKTNVGHTEGAAGVAGLIKAVLALKHGAIPPSLHFTEPSPRIPWDALPVAIPTELTPMPSGDGPRYAGVSAFGITGTNAHIVLESAPARLEPDATEPASDAPVLLPLSAHSPSALRQLAGAYAGYLRAPDAPPIADVAFTAATRRSQLSERLAVVAGSHDEVVGRLTAFAEERPAAGISTGSANDRTPRLIFVFPGQGGQWLGMGLRLAATESVFAASLARCSAAIEGETGWSLVDELEAPEERSRLNEISVVQPAIFAIQVALADLLAHWGLRPDVVIGHSMGEIAAAHVAGILSLEDAAAVICRRSRLLKRVAGKGAMGVVELSLDEARELIAPFDGRLSVASSNGPTTTVLAGEEDALDEALQIVQERRGFARRVRVDVASHSPQVDPLLTELESALADLQPRPARIQLISTVTGEPAAGPEMGSAYWARNLRQPVLFGPVVAELIQGGEIVFLELSPHPVLLGAVEGAARTAGAQAIAVGALRRDQDEAALLREAAGALWTAGIPIDWKRVTPGRVTLPLPSYPWQRERFWFTSTDRATRRTGPVGDFAGPYLGARLPQLAHLPDSHFWQGHFQPPAEQDAVTVSGVSILPGVAAALVAHAAAAAVSGGAVQHLTLEDQPLLNAPVETQTIVTPAGDHSEIRMFTRVGDDEQWTLWATARSAPSSPPPEAIDIATLQDRLSRDAESRPGTLESWQGGTEMLARIEPPVEGEFRHIAVLDVASQLLCENDEAAVHLLAGADGVALYASLDGAVWAYANRRGDDETTGDVAFLAADGDVIAELRGVRLRTPDDDLLRRAATARIDDWTYTFDWRPARNPEGQTSVAGNWLILTDCDGLGSQLAASMERRGARAHLLHESSDNAGTMTRLLCETVSADDPEYTGIIDLRPLDVPGDDLPAVAEQHWGSALALAQSLAEGSLGGTARLWLVTRGAQAAGGPPDNPSAAPLWGLGRVIANEHPEHWGGLIDLDPNPTNSEAELLCDAILLPDGEDEIALRGERRLVSRLTRGSGLGRNVVELHAGSTYLITGGTGGIGLIVARWMIESGARNLVLVGRRPPEEVSATLAELETSGARVTYLQGDVSSGDDVAAIFAAIACDCPPLRGIVHCAADTVDGTLLHQTQTGFNAVFGPKVTGAWNLAAASRGLSLDFLALFSSIGALLGLPGLANYVAANATVDALAQWLRASGVPATSIAWGHWHDVGLAARAGRRESFEHRGLVPMAPEAGIAALSRVLTMDTPHLAIVDVDWARYLAHTRTVAPRFTDLAAELADATDGAATPSGPSLRKRLEATNPADRRDLLLENVRAHAAAVLHLNDSQRISPRGGFNQMGMDSLLAVELKNRLQQILGLSLPPTVAFDYPTPVALAQHLLDETFPSVPAAQLAVGTVDGVIDLPDLSRDELRSLMDAELQLIDKELG